ncbi:hypothetical protein PRK78_004685 [Emydomyces testavorans]|uniref:non-specific serine/threonine protein kinase n=1 Tax=Emydomyces testavorans TaxID=2070801 RepID=A0AAF0IK04_9EURO|nr:hypothetical protein PRK78_004685 [Emydomyces testavorans]
MIPVFKYMPLEDVEKLEQYRPGGFHPVTIGDTLHGRYRIIHKLGFGAYSTTWLARDQIASKYVAIKVTVAAGNPRESSILCQLHAVSNETHPGRTLIMPMLDEFVLEGPNGAHQCFVTPPARMSLSMAKDASIFRLFQLPVARAIAGQLVQAVAFLHCHDIVHADLHLGNVLLCLSDDIDNLLLDQFYEKYGQPNLEPVVHLDNKPLPKGVPTHGIMSVWLGKDSTLISLSEAKILVTDFGESFQPSTTSRHYSHTPDLLIPPEVYFLSQKSLSFPADIWTLAGTIWAIIGQRPLFDGLSSSPDLVIKEHVDVLGKLPPEWPNKRPTADEILEFEWMRKWALPEVERMNRKQ